MRGLAVGARAAHAVEAVPGEHGLLAVPGPLDEVAALVPGVVGACIVLEEVVHQPAGHAAAIAVQAHRDAGGDAAGGLRVGTGVVGRMANVARRIEGEGLAPQAAVGSRQVTLHQDLVCSRIRKKSLLPLPYFRNSCSHHRLIRNYDPSTKFLQNCARRY